MAEVILFTENVGLSDLLVQMSRAANMAVNINKLNVHFSPTNQQIYPHIFPTFRGIMNTMKNFVVFQRLIGRGEVKIYSL